MKEKVVIVSGGFDPIHIGHVRYLKEAAKLGDRLIVILNTDEFLMKKKGYHFMPFEDRKEVIELFGSVDAVIECIDQDHTVCETLKKLKETFKECDLIFAKGGDRTIDNIPEKTICEQFGIEMKFNIGGEKIRSSSGLIKKIRKQEMYNG